MSLVHFYLVDVRSSAFVKTFSLFERTLYIMIGKQSKCFWQMPERSVVNSSLTDFEVLFYGIKNARKYHTCECLKLLCVIKMAVANKSLNQTTQHHHANISCLQLSAGDAQPCYDVVCLQPNVSFLLLVIAFTV